MVNKWTSQTWDDNFFVPLALKHRFTTVVPLRPWTKSLGLCIADWSRRAAAGSRDSAQWLSTGCHRMPLPSGQAEEKSACGKRIAAKGILNSSGCTDDPWIFGDIFDLFTSLGIWKPSLWLIKCQHQIQGIENLRNDRSSWLNHWQSFLLQPSCAPGFWICLNHRRRVAQAVSMVIKSVIMDTILQGASFASQQPSSVKLQMEHRNS